MRIRIVGPSSPFRPEALARGTAVMRAAGHEVVGDDAALVGGHAYLNGSDDERIAALEAALHSDCDVVWLSRGGYGLTRIVDRLRIPPRIPVVVGFSDATALFGRLSREGHEGRCVHGPLATTLGGEGADSVARAFAVIGAAAGDAIVAPALPPLRPVCASASAAEGPLWAGNLVVLAALVGTPSMPSLSGHIVVIEEVGERPYRLDRLLTQLLMAGAFVGVTGLVVGHLTGCDEPTSTVSPATGAKAPSGLEVIVERLRPLGIPVAAGLPCGHEAPNWALPLGAPHRLSLDGDVATLGPADVVPGPHA